MQPLIDQTFLPSQQLAVVNRHIARGEVRQAASKLAELAHGYPDFAPGFHALGWLYANMLDNPKQAVFCFERALELDPTLPPAYYNLIVALNILGRFERIPALAERALGVEGIDRGKVFCQLGVMHELRREYDRAISCYREACRSTLSNEELSSFQHAVQRCELKLTFMDDE